MPTNPELAIELAWLAWTVSWIVAAFWRKPTVKRPPKLQEFVNLAPVALGMGLLFSVRAPEADEPGEALTERLWDTPLWAGWACFAVAVSGFLFCWWARVKLGRLWSGTVTIKPGHHVVDTGPYGLVRHPIYTGLILAAFATAVEKARVLYLAGAALIFFGFWLKARLEERFLRAELGPEAYDAYAARTPMLVPFLF